MWSAPPSGSERPLARTCEFGARLTLGESNARIEHPVLPAHARALGTRGYGRPAEPIVITTFDS